MPRQSVRIDKCIENNTNNNTYFLTHKYTHAQIYVVKEKILKTVPNELIVYTVIGGPLPANNHIGYVTFTELDDHKHTKIHWKVKLTPYFGASLMLKAVIIPFFNIFLMKLERNLKHELKKEASSLSSSTALLADNSASSAPSAVSLEEELKTALSQKYSDVTVVERMFDFPVGPVFKKFHEVVWVKNGGVGKCINQSMAVFFLTSCAKKNKGPASWTKILEEGDPETHEGQVRHAASIMKEKILKVTPNKEIIYSVVGGPFPSDNHLGTITFEEIDKKTIIVWKVQYTPKTGMNQAIKATCQTFFPIFLLSLDNALKSEKAA